MKHEQLALFQPQSMPAGFRYAPDVIDAEEEARLVTAFAGLPFKEFEFHGFLGKRRVVSFGFRYDFNGGGLTEAEPMPPFLLPVRERAAVFAGLVPDRLRHVLITEYRPGAATGSASRLSRRAPSGCAAGAARAGSAPPCGSTAARSISCAAPRATNGSTASPQWT
jgi:hypothetical protein